jgi:large subunit ribosomal protein L21
MDYAVFKTGGKQYRVQPGDTLDVELLKVGVDSVAEFADVLAISDGGEVTFGSPFVAGARVLARVESHYKDRKVMVYKYKAKTRYRRKRSHRQGYTRLLIQDIRLEQPGTSTPRGRARARPAEAQESQEGGNE